MSINGLMADAGPDVYYDKGFRDVLEDHLTLLREQYSTVMVLTPDESYQWRGDLYGLLHAKGRPRHLHWLVMRLNNLMSPTQFSENTFALLYPNETMVDQILQSHNSGG